MVDILLYNNQANPVSTIFHSQQLDGKYNISININELKHRALPRGFYYLLISIGDETLVKKILISNRL